MAITPEDLLELARFKFERHYDSARLVPQGTTIPDRGVWKHTATNGSGEVQTLSVRLGNDLLEIKQYPVERPHLIRPQLADIWYFDVSHPPRQELLFHLSERVESGISVGLSPTGGPVPEALLPKDLMKSMEKILLAV